MLKIALTTLLTFIIIMITDGVTLEYISINEERFIYIFSWFACCLYSVIIANVINYLFERR